MKILGRRTLLTTTLLLGLGLAAAQTQPPATPPTTPPTTPPPTTAPAQPPATPAPATPAPAAPAQPATPATEQAPATSEEATLTVSSAAITLPALPDATLVRNFTTVLGAGVVYRGSVLGSIDEIAEALVTAGFTAVEGDDSADTATGEGTADTAAAGTTDTAAAGAATGTAATGTAATGTAAATPPVATPPAATTPATGTAATGTTDTAATGTTDTATTGAAASASGTGLSSLPEGVVRTFERGGERFELRAYERGGFTVVVISRLGRAAAAPAGG